MVVKSKIKQSEQLENTIRELTYKLDKHKAKNQKLAYENQKLKQKLENAMGSAINQNELDGLRLQNDKLIVELNQYKRIVEKYKRIIEIIKGE